MNNVIDNKNRQQTGNDYCCHKIATVKTNEAERLLQRLCKHFSHKVNVKWKKFSGVIEFSMGVCYLEANNASLHFHCEAKNTSDLDEIIDTIDSHITRFSRNEDIALNWK